MCWCLPGSTGDSLEVWQELDLERVEKELRGVLSRGITSLAVLLLHSYTSVGKLVSDLSGMEAYLFKIYLLFAYLSAYPTVSANYQVFSLVLLLFFLCVSTYYVLYYTI